jgi:UDP-N-acetylmuramoyl-tripeptide--D-alanyl-D-alanine ligase
MAIEELPSGAILVDDTYNASPVSVGAALAFLAETPVTGRRLAVLGDMLELGPDEQALHERIGVQAASVLDGLVVVGERGLWIAAAARSAGLSRIATAQDVDAAAAVVDQVLDPAAGDVLLVKGSRGVELDRLVASLLGRDPDEEA